MKDNDEFRLHRSEVAHSKIRGQKSKKPLGVRNRPTGLWAKKDWTVMSA